MNDTTLALSALRDAWPETCKDYGKRKLNSERSLQSALYFHLRRLLERKNSEFRVFTEAVVRPNASSASKKDQQASKIMIDTLVCVRDSADSATVVLAIELKFTPRSFPRGEGLQKDIASLDRMRNRRSGGDTIVLERHAEGPMKLRFSPDTKMVLGIFCSAREPVDLKDFWGSHRPSEGPWAKSFRAGLPPKLGLCMAYAPKGSHRASQSNSDNEKPAEADCVGPAFADLA